MRNMMKLALLAFFLSSGCATLLVGGAAAVGSAAACKWGV